MSAIFCSSYPLSLKVVVLFICRGPIFCRTQHFIASSSLGTFYGTSRVLQSIASQKVIPFIRVLANGVSNHHEPITPEFLKTTYSLFQRGPNRVPVYALMVAASVTLIFICVGPLNTLATIVTMPFLPTYATIDYAYFALAQSFNIQQAREERFRSVLLFNWNIIKL